MVNQQPVLLSLLLSNCLKGYTKGKCLYKVIPLHTIHTVTQQQLQKQNNIHDTITKLNKHYSRIGTVSV